MMRLLNRGKRFQQDVMVIVLHSLHSMYVCRADCFWVPQSTTRYQDVRVIDDTSTVPA